MGDKELAILFTADPVRETERASMGLSIANAALATETKVKVFFALDGINTIVKGRIDGIKGGHFAPLKELLEYLVDEGGEVHACSPFMAERNIGEEDLIDGVTISSAPTLVHDAESGVITI